jgi:hypothetical protein
MSWEAVGAIGEVVGALGVIATLGYLAVQIRQNTASVRASTAQAMFEASAGLHDLCAADSELGRIFLRGAEDQGNLKPGEQVRFHFLMMSFLRRLENIHHQGVSGRLHEDDWSGLRTSALGVLAQPGARAWWTENADRFNPKFAEWAARGAERNAV